MSKYICFLFFLLPITGWGQEAVATHLAQAKTAHADGNVQDARFELQQALSELDILISQEILAMLPTEIGNMQANTEEDAYVGNAMGFAGIFIDRYYQNDDQSQQLKVTLVSDSPLLSSLNAFLNNALVARMSGKKVIRIEGYKAIIEQVENSDPVAFNVQIPFSQSLLTLEFEGFEDQDDIEKYSRQIPVKDIVKIAQ